MRLSQTKAAKLAGVSRGTIANRIKDGLLTEQHDGIDVADICRVFPDVKQDRIDRLLSGQSLETKNESPDKNQNDREMAELIAANNEWLRTLIDKKEQQIEYLQSQLEDSLQENKEINHRLQVSVTRLLEAPKKRRIFGFNF